MNIQSLPRIHSKAKFLSVMVAIAVLLVISLSLYSPFRSWVTAQIAGQSIEVSPPTQEVTADPGQSITIHAKVTNKTNAALPMSVHIEDFLAKGEEGLVALTTNSQYSITSWTKVSPTHFTLQAGEQKEVTATITVPTGVAGGRYGSFVFATDTEKKGGTASVSQEIASLFLLRISGKVNEVLEISDIQAPAYSEFGPIPVNIKFTNKGNIHVKTYGLVNVTDMFGNKVEDIVVKATNVFPDSNRIVTATLNKKFLFGSYKVTAIMYYGSDQLQTVTATTKFFAFPTRLAVGAVVILFLLLIARKRIGKALKALFK